MFSRLGIGPRIMSGFMTIVALAMVVGGVVMCAGAAMLGVDLARRKTRRTTAAISLHPAFSGVSITRRF